MKSPIKTVPAVTQAAPVNQKSMTKTTDETEKARERLHGERDVYKKAKQVEVLKEIERASLKLQESFDAGWQWGHSASYETLKDVAEGGRPT